RAHQRGAGNLAREPGAVVRALARERVRDRAHRQREIRAGVAVRDGIDVEVVDVAAVSLDGGLRARHQITDMFAHALARTRGMTTSTAATSNPVSRVTSLATCDLTVAATSARFRPCSTTTCSPRRSPCVSP